jgi:5-methylcytosine-specific restriction enzyme subunit McrC
MIRPDIVINSGGENYVIDTKWKVLKENKPSDDDLKQMYTYNLHFASKHSLLVYPFVNDIKNRKGEYHLKHHFDSKEEAHYCQIVFVDIFDNIPGKRRALKTTLGNEILNLLVENGK